MFNRRQRIVLTIAVLLVPVLLAVLWWFNARLPAGASPIQFRPGDFPLVTSDPAAASVAAILNANGDDYPDVLLINGDSAQLFLQQKISWAVEKLELGASGVQALLAVDLDRDDVSDLVLSTARGLRLLYNDGSGRFVDRTPAQPAGAAHSAPALALAAGDINGDGIIDLVEARGGDAGDHRLWLGKVVEGSGIGFSPVPLPIDACCRVRAARLADMDEDGDLDLLLVGDGTAPMLYANEGGSFARAVELPGGRSCWTAVLPGDYDNDRDLDLLLLRRWRPWTERLSGGEGDDCAPGTQLLLANQGKLSFTPVTQNTGLERLPSSSAGVWIDVDNDRLLDLVVLRSDAMQTPLLLHQYTDGRFRDVTAGSGIRHHGTVIGPLAGDLTGNGYPDLLWFDASGTRMLANAGGRNHWLSVRLRGRERVPVIGARVALFFGDGSRMEQQFLAGDGGRLQHADTVHFGLGRQARFDSIRIRWPRARYTRLDGSFIDRYIGFVEPSEESGGQNVRVQNPILEGLLRQRQGGQKKLICR